MARILIVDDHILNRQFLTTLLGFYGHSLLEASDGEEALRAVVAQRPALVITDIMMPNMSGYEFVTQMRADVRVARTPVIFYTSTYSTREARAMARACDVRWVLQKPTSPDLILQTVQEALGLPQATPVPLSVGTESPAQSPLATLDNQLNAYLQDLESGSQLMTRIAAGSDVAAEGDSVQHITQRFSQSLSELQTVSLRLTALIDMGLELSVERDPVRLVETCCRVVRHISVARYAVLGMLDDTGEALSHFAVRGLEGPVVNQLAALAPLAPALAALGKGAGSQRLLNPGGDPREVGLPASHPPVHSFLAVSVASSGRSYGWIYLVDKLGADGFSEMDERAVTTVATQVAVAYENIRLYAAVQDHVTQLERDLVERKRIADQLSESEERFRQLAEVLREREAGLQRAQLVAKMAHVITGPSGEFESWSNTLPQLIGQVDATMPPDTRRWMEFILPADQALFRDTCIVAGRTGERREVVYRLRRRDGVVIDIHQVLEPLQAQVGAGTRTRWFNTLQDITEHTEQQRKIARLSQTYAVLSSINSAIVRIHDRDALLQEACRIAVSQGAFSAAWAGVVDPQTLDGQVVALYGGKQGIAAKIGFSAHPDSPLRDRPTSIALREKRPMICNDLSTAPMPIPMRQEMLQDGILSAAWLPLIVEDRAVAVFSLLAGEAGFFDVDALRLLNELVGDLSFGLQFISKEERLSYLAYYDALTGLPNATLFGDRLAQILQAAAGREDMVAVIMVNIDRFAQLNDAFGRESGDRVLKMVAQRLKDALREPYSLGRMGGDTFAITISGWQRGADAAVLLEQRILHGLDQPFVLPQQELRIGVRAGIALYPADGGDVETLLKHAEVALKKAKSSQDRYLYYAPQMNKAIAARMALEGSLRDALAAGQFVMYYQPRVDLQSGHIVSAEALIRWRHPQRGMVSPAEFIPLAEETGQIVPLGDWVIDAVCAQQAAWLKQRAAIVPVAINLSAVQFKKGKVIQTVRDALARYGLEQRHIEFELTESMVMDDPEEATRNLEELKKMGAMLSLDDFGTGYSSLAYLKRFPFDFVKIDRAFVMDVTDKPEDAAICTAVIAMAHSLGLRVVAEGVETEAQLQFLRRHWCDEMQGYYFSPPVPAVVFEAMLREGRVLPLAPLPVQREQTLLIADDARHTLAALRRVLRQEGYRVLVAASGQEALALLALNPVQVVLTGPHTPGMAGAELLRQTRALYPETVCTLLSPAADAPAAAEHLQPGVIFHLLPEPWDDRLLREQIRAAFLRYQPRP